MRSKVPARFHCCLSQDVAAGGIHYKGSGAEVLTGGIMLDTALLGSIANSGSRLRRFWPTYPQGIRRMWISRLLMHFSWPFA